MIANVKKWRETLHVSRFKKNSLIKAECCTNSDTLEYRIWYLMTAWFQKQKQNKTELSFTLVVYICRIVRTDKTCVLFDGNRQANTAIYIRITSSHACISFQLHRLSNGKNLIITNFRILTSNCENFQVRFVVFASVNNLDKTDEVVQILLKIEWKLYSLCLTFMTKISRRTKFWMINTSVISFIV